MRTAMQELIHDFKHGKFNLLSNSKIDSELENYLQKEKQQMVDFYVKGCDDTYGIDEPNEQYPDEESGGIYYSQKFNKHQ